MFARTFLVASLLFVVTAQARTIIVAKTGGDYATIQAGLNAATAGDTVLVRAGSYAEFVTWPTSGSAVAGPIVLKAYGDGPAVIDGATLTPTAGRAELLLISDRSYVSVVGMELCRNVTSSANVFNKGIQVEGTSQHVLIQGCRIHHIENNNTGTNAGANAIGVFGSNGTTSVSDVRIDSCDIDSCKTGYSEAISIDGNVDGFRVSRCHVHDNNNIGILFAGYYGECPVPAVDQARHGVISDNRVERCSSCNNPAYAGDCSADGIYSDGGGKTLIERNVVTGCDIGIEAGAELAGAIDDSVVIRDNLIYNCNTGGLFIGGYATGRGWTMYCRVENNTFYQNDLDNTGSGEILIQKAHDNIIRNNIVYTTAQKTGISAAFNSTYTYNNAVSRNLYWSASGGSGIDGLTLDSHPVSGNPLFVTAGSNFRPQQGSAALDSCDVAYVPSAGELDLDGLTRKQGSAVDIGAYEFGSAVVVARFAHGTAPAVTRPRLVLLSGTRGLAAGVAVMEQSRSVLPSGRTVPARR